MRIKLSVIFLLIILLMNIVFPVLSNATSMSEIQSAVNQFKTIGENSTKISEDKLGDIFIPVAKILLTVGSIVLVVVTLVMAIKWMTANPEEQAKLKQQLIGLVIAIIVIYGAQAIWAVFYSLFSDI